MSTKTEELSGLHASFQSHLNTLIAAGEDPLDAVEAMLTVALANQVKIEGPRAAAESLRIVAQFLAAETVSGKARQ